MIFERQNEKCMLAMSVRELVAAYMHAIPSDRERLFSKDVGTFTIPVTLGICLRVDVLKEIAASVSDEECESAYKKLEPLLKENP